MVAVETFLAQIQALKDTVLFVCLFSLTVKSRFYYFYLNHFIHLNLPREKLRLFHFFNAVL